MESSTESRALMRVRVFLDFDGVLNPEGRPPCDLLADWRAATVNGVAISWSPTLAARLGRLADHADVLWLTTWARNAQIHLTPLLGLPSFELAGVDHFETPWRWWKLDVVTELWNTDPRPFVWIDDDLTLFDEASDWVRGLGHERALAIAPDPSVGLTPDHLDTIDRFVAAHRNSPDAGPAASVPG